MDQYCVVLCGLQAETSGDAAAWQPVAAALKLNPAEFERRVVAALPRIVRQHLDRDTADRIAQLLHAMHVDARVLPDDPQLAYIARVGATCGPLPQSSLGTFILPGEPYRLHGSTEWQDWPTPGEEETVAPDMDFNDFDEAPSSTSASDEPVDDMLLPTPVDAYDDISETWADEPAVDPIEPQYMTPASDTVDQPDGFGPADAAADDSTELPRAVPPPLPSAPAAESPSTAESSDDVDATTPDLEYPASAGDDELINPVQEENLPDAPEASDSASSEDAGMDDAAPRRSHTGRVIMLLVLAALAVWAYRYWMADTRTDVPPPAVRTIQPHARPAQATPPAQVVAGDPSTTTPASPASVATAASTPAAAASATAPASTGSSPAPATTTPPAAASAPAPAASTATPAKSGIGTLPARTGTIMPAQPAPVAAASVSAPTTLAR